MKTFNVAMLSDDSTMKMSYFFMTKANCREEAIQLAKNELRLIIIGQYGSLKPDNRLIESDLLDFTPQIFELKEI